MLGLVDGTSWLVFVVYITLFVINNLLVALTKNSDNDYNYNTVFLVLLIEFLKLIISVLFYIRNHSFGTLVGDLQRNKSAFAYYLVPSSLYCIFNNLVFLSLASFDPTTYTVLLQFSIVTTAFMYQCIFQRNLSWVQWISLVFLTIGCTLCRLNGRKEFLFEVKDLLIIIQILCSSFAGVYNEYLLKGYDGELNFWLQNIIMYWDSCLCGVFLMTVTANLGLINVNLSSVRSLGQPIVLAIVCNNVTAGLVTSKFLHKLNSIIKKFAAAIEMILLATASSFLLGTSIGSSTIISILLVSSSIVIYSLNPIRHDKVKIVKVQPQNQE